jgi:hypothetical protein
MQNKLTAWGIALATYAPIFLAAKADKGDPPTATPQLTYKSAFDDYKADHDAPLADWRDLNDNVVGAP